METFGDLAWTLREELLADCRAAENPDWPGTTTSNAARALQGANALSLGHCGKARAKKLSWQPSISVQEPLLRSNVQGGHPHRPSSRLPSGLPMSLARRLGGCCILLSLASSPYLMYKYVAEMLPALLFNDWPFLTSFALGISVVVLSFLFFALVKEAKRSQLGRMLTGEVVPVADFFSSDKQLSVLGGPEMELLAFCDDTESIEFQQPGREGIQPQPTSEGMDDAIARSRHEVLRLRLPVRVRVTLADAHTGQRCLTLQHKFYFEGKEQLSVQVQHQHGMAVISRTWPGLPFSFRLLRGAYSVSVYLMLSWVPRIVVLLFFPMWIDPAVSDVYCHRKVLVIQDRVRVGVP